MIDKDKKALHELFLLARIGNICCAWSDAHKKRMVFVINPDSHCDEDRELTTKERIRANSMATKEQKLYKRMLAATDAYNKSMK